jgi:hypothetical protein
VSDTEDSPTPQVAPDPVGDDIPQYRPFVPEGDEHVRPARTEE